MGVYSEEMSWLGRLKSILYVLFSDLHGMKALPERLIHVPGAYLLFGEVARIAETGIEEKYSKQRV